ncbi:MAG: SHOCT domain-containing protein [Devosia nanyangense]|uniref:SHOCT domain-containing protein n=1 Tax=Devosia nanyangense TaxID=1228055 RepID=A0A933L4V9_9HYPH|nr:SHOCT domain-containing protein [Devosia nanyangense]
MWWHGPHLFGWGWMPGFGLISILFWVLVVGLIVAAVRASRQRVAQDGPNSPRSGLTILEERYAKGEIQRDEYLQKKGDLGA